MDRLLVPCLVGHLLGESTGSGAGGKGGGWLAAQLSVSYVESPSPGHPDQMLLAACRKRGLKQER